MAEWLFIGPRLLAGIGQVTNQYARLVRDLGHKAEYVVLGERPLKQRYDRGFAFVLPVEDHLRAVDEYAKLCGSVMHMTVCETEPVNPAYGILARYRELYVPSEFARSTLARQFPDVTWKLLRHWAVEGPHKAPAITGPYVFYTIGNILDPRKNIRGLIDAYLRCEFRDSAHLVLKATCMQPVEWRVPGVTVLNGLMSDEELEGVHARSHCYINCSHSEGVGMGAVEAAMRAKPVIIADYGGLKEYVQTPWVVPCTKGPIGFTDFLFTPELEWGRPDLNVLQKHMWDCFTRRVTTWNHAHTRALVDEVRESRCWT